MVASRYWAWFRLGVIIDIFGYCSITLLRASKAICLLTNDLPLMHHLSF